MPVAAEFTAGFAATGFAARFAAVELVVRSEVRHPAPCADLLRLLLLLLPAPLRHATPFGKFSLFATPSFGPVRATCHSADPPALAAQAAGRRENLKAPKDGQAGRARAARRAREQERRCVAVMTTSRTDVFVLGAGPYGVSAYAHLKRYRVRTRIAGEPMRTWRTHMPTGMYLKSTPPASTIAAGRPGFRLDDFCRATEAHMPVEHEAVPIGLFLDYGNWFTRALAPEVERTEVTSIARDGSGGFRIETAQGDQIEARSVIVASGLIGHAYVPAELAPLTAAAGNARVGASAGAKVGAASGARVGASGGGSVPAPGQALVSHSSEHDDLSVFAGQDVVVVGAGQSALESAALLAEAGARPAVVVRGPRVRFAGSPFAPPEPGLPGLYSRIPKPQGPLGPGWPLLAVAKGPEVFRHLPDSTRLDLVARVLGPAGAWWLRDRVEGRIPIRTGRRIVGASADGARVGVELADSAGRVSVLEADHVISATGYRLRRDSFPFLSPELRGAVSRVNHWPRLKPGYESAVPGLYFVGFPSAATFGPLMRFVCGTEYAGPRVARAAAERAGAR